METNITVYAIDSNILVVYAVSSNSNIPSKPYLRADINSDYLDNYEVVFTHDFTTHPIISVNNIPPYVNEIIKNTTNMPRYISVLTYFNNMLFKYYVSSTDGLTSNDLLTHFNEFKKDSTEPTHYEHVTNTFTYLAFGIDFNGIVTTYSIEKNTNIDLKKCEYLGIDLSNVYRDQPNIVAANTGKINGEIKGITLFESELLFYDFDNIESSNIPKYMNVLSALSSLFEYLVKVNKLKNSKLSLDAFENIAKYIEFHNISIDISKLPYHKD